jgi:hypothetical protein
MAGHQGQQVDMQTQQRLQLDLQAAKVDQRCTGQGIYQQVDIAAFVVGAVQYRAEYAWLVVGNRATVAQTAARCISSTREGRMGILSGRKLLKC